MGSQTYINRPSPIDVAKRNYGGGARTSCNSVAESRLYQAIESSHRQVFTIFACRKIAQTSLLLSPAHLPYSVDMALGMKQVNRMFRRNGFEWKEYVRIGLL